jgi:hypothetical protein
MSKPKPFKDTPTGGVLVDGEKKVVGFISYCGAFLWMPVGKRRQRFELHSYHGPMPCRKDGCTTLRCLRGFYDQYEKWEKGGRLVDGDVCVVAKK